MRCSPFAGAAAAPHTASPRRGRAGRRPALGVFSTTNGDTAKVLFGMGTYGNRSLAVGGTAIIKAVDKLIAKGRKIAAHLMEAADTDVISGGGQFKVAGTDKAVPFAQASLTA